MNKPQLDDLFQFRMTGDGPFFVNTSAIGNDGRAVAQDGTKAFNGQVFLNPDAGSIGSLQRRMLSGPKPPTCSITRPSSSPINPSTR